MTIQAGGDGGLGQGGEAVEEGKPHESLDVLSGRESREGLRLHLASVVRER